MPASRQGQGQGQVAFLDPEEALYQLSKEKNPGLVFTKEAASLTCAERWVSDPTEDAHGITFRIILRKICDTRIGPNNSMRNSIRASLVVEALMNHKKVVRTRTRVLGLYINSSLDLASVQADTRLLQCAKRLKLKVAIKAFSPDLSTSTLKSMYRPMSSFK